jgi:hypothetical protein
MEKVPITYVLDHVSIHWLGKELCELGVLTSNQSLVVSQARLHAEMVDVFRHHCSVADHRHLGWAFAGAPKTSMSGATVQA